MAKPRLENVVKYFKNTFTGS